MTILIIFGCLSVLVIIMLWYLRKTHNPALEAMHEDATDLAMYVLQAEWHQKVIARQAITTFVKNYNGRVPPAVIKKTANELYKLFYDHFSENMPRASK